MKRSSLRNNFASDTRRFTAERKVQASYVFALICLAAVGIVSYLSVQQLRASASWVENTHQVLTHLDHLQALTTDAETAERGYVITGDEDYLAMYTTAAGALGEAERGLGLLIADNPVQEQRLQHLIQLVSDRMARLRVVEEARRRNGFAAAQELIQRGAGKVMHGQLQKQIEEMASVERSLLDERQRRVDDGTKITLLITVCSSLFAVGCMAWARLVSCQDLAARRRIEAERETLRERLAVQLEDLRRLHDLSSKLIEVKDAPKMLEEILEAAIDLQQADFGNIQLYEPDSGSLRIVAQRGFSQDFLDHFRVVRADDPSVCGRALQSRARVVIEDVEKDPEFAPHLSVAAQAGFRGVQSTPLFGHDGALIGMLSTHFREPHRPSDHDLQMTDLYIHTAKTLIERAQDMEAIRSARDEADRANRAMSRFLSTASHDLRQPLQTLSLLNGTLGRLVVSEHAAAVVKEQQQAITTMSSLVNALLDIGKLQSGGQRIQACPSVRGATYRVLEDCYRKRITVGNRGLSRVRG